MREAFHLIHLVRMTSLCSKSTTAASDRLLPATFTGKNVYRFLSSCMSAQGYNAQPEIYPR